MNFTCGIPLMLSSFVPLNASCGFNPHLNVPPMNYKRSACCPYARLVPALSSYTTGFPLCISSYSKTSTV